MKTQNHEPFLKREGEKNGDKREMIRIVEVDLIQGHSELQLGVQLGEEKAKIIETLKTKVDLKDNDSVLRRHLDEEEGKQKQPLVREIHGVKLK
jgi:hypothetical protein